jgi:hypothetical protein
VAVNFLGPECLIVPAIEVGGFCIENSKWYSVYLRKATVYEHFNGPLYFDRYLSKWGFHFYWICFVLDAYFFENHIYKNRQLMMRSEPLTLQRDNLGSNWDFFIENFTIITEYWI